MAQFQEKMISKIVNVEPVLRELNCMAAKIKEPGGSVKLTKVLVVDELSLGIVFKMCLQSL